MFTDCPDCRRQFRVRAPQLAAAAGQVRCGYCGCQFDALQRLHDEPLPAPALQTPAPEPPAPPPPPVRASAPVQPPPPPRAPHEDDDEDDEEAEEEAQHDASFLLPDLAEPEAPRSARSRIFWGLALVLLLLAGALQGAWFQRDWVLTRYPALTPWVQRLCEKLRCEVIRYHDLSAIRIVNRDVRLHPLYENSLLVNATIENDAKQLQPWPDVQLVLYDTSGKAVAYRRFAPSEYLEAGIDVERGMQPDQSAHFVLEVTGATDRAVSFEFGFL